MPPDLRFGYPRCNEVVINKCYLTHILLHGPHLSEYIGPPSFTFEILDVSQSEPTMGFNFVKVS